MPLRGGAGADVVGDVRLAAVVHENGEEAPVVAEGGGVVDGRSLVLNRCLCPFAAVAIGGKDALT